MKSILTTNLIILTLSNKNHSLLLFLIGSKSLINHTLANATQASSNFFYGWN